MSKFFYHQILADRFVLNLKEWKNSRRHFFYWYLINGHQVIKSLPGTRARIPIWILPMQGVPHLHPIIFPLVPCSFLGGTPMTGPMSLPGGFPRLWWGNPPARLRSGTPHQVRMGYLQPGLDGVPPAQDWGTPPPPAPEQITLEQVMTQAVRLLQFPAGRLSCLVLLFSCIFTSEL